MAPELFISFIILGLLVVCIMLARQVQQLTANNQRLALQNAGLGTASRIDEYHPLLEPILDERKKNAGDFTDALGIKRLSPAEAYDKAILAAYYAVEGALKKARQAK